MNKVYFFLILIVIFSFIVRVYKIDSVPPSLTWDEADVGYNAWAIANYGRDEYGKFFPLYFKSFGDDKQPIHIYITAIFVKLFGLSEFSTRLPAAIFGTLNALLIFFLAKMLFKSDTVGLLSAFFLSISPQNIHFSRFNHEVNFALFFFILGLVIFYFFIKRGKFLYFSLLSFILSMISYRTSEIITPLILFTLIFMYRKKIFENKNNLLLSAIILITFITMFIVEPRLAGGARFNQTVQGNSDIERTQLFKQTHNYLLGRINLFFLQYSWHFDPKFLFISGDKNPRLSSQGAGEFYKIDAIFLILGFLSLIRKKSKEGVLLLVWALLGPLPSALFAEAPHGARASFMMGSWHIIAALGFYSLINSFKKTFSKWSIGIIFTIILLFSLSNYFKDYLTEFPKRYAIDWQYGMKQVVEFVKTHEEYSQVSITDVRSQPYVFFLYYLKTPLPEYLNTVVYNRSRENKSYNTVSNFDRYYFGGWDPIESLPERGVLYIITSSQFDGLRHKSSFEVKKIIYYPNETIAFYVITSL